MNARLLPEAWQELDEAADYYDLQQYGVGKDFLDDVYRWVAVIVAQPRSFAREWPTSRSREVRRCIMMRFSYSIVYEVLPNEIVILAIAHSSRRPYYWRKRRP